MLICILLRKDNPFSYKIEDKVTTDKKKKAATKVEDQYTYKSEYKQNKVDIVNDVLLKWMKWCKRLKLLDRMIKKMTDAEKVDKLKRNYPLT